MPKVSIGLFPHQHAAVTCEAPELLLSGAWGSGKSRALCVKALVHMQHPGNQVALLRKKLQDLKLTTLRTLLKADGTLPPVLPEGTYEHNRADRTIQMHGGGELYYTGFDDPERLRSLNLGLVLVDQAEEMAEEEFTDLVGRLRNPSAPYRQIMLACNPAAKSHFLYERFLDGVPIRKDEHGIRWCERDRSVAIVSSTHDNPTLPADYINRLLTGLSDQAIRRYFYGEWVTFEGLVYDRWDRAIHLVKRAGERWRRLLVGVDAGYTNPACLLTVGQDEAGALHVIDEFYRPGLTEDELTSAAMDIWQKRGPEAYLVDPSAASLIAALRKANLPVRAANNEVYAGIQRIQIRLTPPTKLTVEPTCVNLIKEFEAYSWKDSKAKDEPVKAFDHALDGLRYVVADVDKRNPIKLYVMGGDDSPEARYQENVDTLVRWSGEEPPNREDLELAHLSIDNDELFE